MNPHKNYMYYQQHMPFQQMPPNVYYQNFMHFPQMYQQQYFPQQMQQMYPPPPPQFYNQQVKLRQQQPKIKENIVKPKPVEVKKTLLDGAALDANVKTFSKVGFCHYCNINNKICYYCFNQYQGTQCQIGYCFDCLLLKFKMNPIKILLRSEWQCPAKERTCDCCLCSTHPHPDSDVYVSQDSVESFNRYNHIIENSKKIKKQTNKRRNIIKEIFQIKFQNLDTRKKKIVQTMAQKKSIQNTKIKRQLQFTAELLIKLKSTKMNPQDEQILHQVLRYNFGTLVEQFTTPQ